jgi:hypothetical protein
MEMLAVGDDNGHMSFLYTTKAIPIECDKVTYAENVE